MKIVRTAVEGVLVLEPQRIEDDRGFFMESYHRQRFDEAVGRRVEFVQDNQSRSTLGVLRGLHFQRGPHAQGKLVRVVAGTVYDVAVDLRTHSATRGCWVGVELSDANARQLWIPEGFAHGFLVLSQTADVIYKTTSHYSPSSEGSVRFDDPTLRIDWPTVPTGYLLSAKDAAAPPYQAVLDHP